MTQNALSHLFRSQSYFLSLPSKGKYYQNPPELSADQELGLMPMTAADELKLNSPDGLFNGEGLYELFQSCAPGIKNPKEIPVIDIDAILIGIRLAAGENEISMSSTCPECKHVAEYQIDLNQIVRSIKPKSFENKIEVRDGVEVVLRPITLEVQIKSQIEAFYQLQIEKSLSNASEDVGKYKDVFDKAMKSVINLQIDQLTSSIQSVILTDVVVNDRESIREWVVNMTKSDHKKITDQIMKISETDIMNEMAVSCPECGHNYNTKIDLNPANFF